MKHSNCLISDSGCDTCSARASSVFAELAPIDLRTMSGARRCRVYARGEPIFQADHYPVGLYCIHHGRVKIYRTGGDGREQIIRLAKDGDILGYRSLISGDRYSTFAVPIEEAQICHIPRHVFFSLLGTNPGLSARIMKLLANELKAAENRIVELAQKPVRERLAETLLLLKETYGLDPDGQTLGITLTRNELAGIIGTATESVSRLLSKLKAEGIIEMNGRKILLIDHDALVEAANHAD